MKKEEKDLQLTMKNVQKIIDELPPLAEKIPEIREDFDMLVMGVYSCYEFKEIVSFNYCKTHGCGLGNSARLFDKSDKRYYDQFNEFNFVDTSLSLIIVTIFIKG